MRPSMMCRTASRVGVVEGAEFGEISGEGAVGVGERAA
jgi:hypothetical protein